MAVGLADNRDTSVANSPYPTGRSAMSSSRQSPLRAALRRADKVVVIAAGGALGSGARYGVAEVMPHAPGELAWSTVSVNLTGGFLLGLLMVFLLDVWGTTRYVRPFFGIGVLGGYTTFSTYLLDAWTLLQAGHAAAAAVYLLGTLVVGLVAVWAGLVAARSIVRLGRLQRRHPRQPAAAEHSTTASRSTR
jgi:CrcB protein